MNLSSRSLDFERLMWFWKRFGSLFMYSMKVSDRPTFLTVSMNVFGYFMTVFWAFLRFFNTIFNQNWFSNGHKKIKNVSKLKKQVFLQQTFVKFLFRFNKTCSICLIKSNKYFWKFYFFKQWTLLRVSFWFK